MDLRTRIPALLTVAALAILTGASLTGASAPVLRQDSRVNAAAANQSNWQWPVRSPWEIKREFIAPPSQYGAGHRGVDLRTGPGDGVVAPADGIVFFVGVVVDRPVISIQHPGGLMSSFEPVVSQLVTGQQVTRGQLIGTTGAGGHCADSCLHFGVRLHGQYISPRLPIGSLPRAVLLPVSDG